MWEHTAARMPERHGLPPIVKFSVLAFCGLLVVVGVSVAVVLAAGGRSHRSRRSAPDLAARTAACNTAHDGGPFDHLRYPYTTLPIRPEDPPLTLEVPPGYADDFDTRQVSREPSDGGSTLLGTALFYGTGDDPSDHPELLSILTNQRTANGQTPQPTTIHGHPAYRTSRATANPNNIIFGSTPCGILLVLSNDDHTATALWRRLAEPPAER